MRFTILISLIVLSTRMIAGDTLSFQRQIHWQGTQVFHHGDNLDFHQLLFDGAQYNLETPSLPFYYESLPLSGATMVREVIIREIAYGVPDTDLGWVTGIEKIGEEIIPEFTVSYDRQEPHLVVSFVPLRLNPYNQQFEWLMEFDLIVVVEEQPSQHQTRSLSYAGNSVLSTGSWYKFSVRKDGVYKISAADLQVMGLNLQSIDPRHLRIFGNGGGMLPESLDSYRADDLLENAITVVGEEDGKFDPGDYILFYGQSPHRWVYDESNSHFNHVSNIYSDRSCYFITADLGPGKRITTLPSATLPVTVNVNKFTDMEYHERDIHNLVNAGRVWYGEVFDIKTTYDTTFSFPDIDVGSQGYFKAYVAAKSTMTSTFKFYDGQNLILTGNVNGIPGSSDTYARNYIGSADFYPSSANLKIGINFQKPTSSSTGWLNYFEVNVVRFLKFHGPQMVFRSPQAVAPSAVAEFTLSNAGSQVNIWDVTNPANVARIDAGQNGTSKIFRLEHDSLREFLAWDGQSFLTVEQMGQVANQDIHGMEVPEMVIIYHQSFMDQAERLANFHRTHDDMSVEVIDIEKVYNEFSSGSQDVSAIRNMVKMMLDRSSENSGLRYLLLFGDASFDYKDKIKNNSNFVPTWQAEESLTIVYSIASDDYYGLLDGPGDNLLDIGIGRLPVENADQARQAVDKIIHYATNNEVVMHDWRNVVTFVADDEDANLHLNQAEEMAIFLDTNYGSYNVDKIYVDAFPQYATAGGQRTPDVNKAINSRISKGTLIMNYTGHGGEVGWGHERFLEISDINSWRNYNMLPIFITATCEFSRYDDPERLSAGEMVFRNPAGGAVAMFTTARATFGGSNFNLNKALFEVIFEKNNGESYRFGDLIRIAKNKNGVVDNDKKFILLGDPALKLAYPEFQVDVTSVNGIPVSPDPDTLRALSTVEISGRITDGFGNLMPGFDGTLYSIVFDKPNTISTLVTDELSRPAEFDLQNNTLYKGKAMVENGQFSFSFIVPKDIAYKYGFGKISFYAATDNIDANGYYRNLVIGGFDSSAEPDDKGPDIALFMNDTLFEFGGMTDENPVMLAYVSDESGINTVGSGIGHDIVAILDGNTDKPIILNEYYEAELNSFKKGTVSYPFLNLSPGLHTLRLKVWDVFNNSSEAYLEFIVNPSGEFRMEQLINYPNPFNEGTNFVFEHNQPEKEFDILIQIFDLSGRLAKVIETTAASQGYRAGPIYWNGCDDGGYRIAKGVYLYRVTVRDQVGRVMVKSGKMVKTD